MTDMARLMRGVVPNGDCDAGQARDFSARDWAEVGGGISAAGMEQRRGTLTTSITPNQTTTYVSRLGVVQAF